MSGFMDGISTSTCCGVRGGRGGGRRHRGRPTPLPHPVGHQRGAAAVDDGGGRAALRAQRPRHRPHQPRRALARPGRCPSGAPWSTAALAPATFDPRTTERTLRLGLSDSAELWALPRCSATLEREAPRLRIVAIPVQFRHRRRRAGRGLRRRDHRRRRAAREQFAASAVLRRLRLPLRPPPRAVAPR